MTAVARAPAAALDALRRTIRRPPPTADSALRCQLCSAPLAERHRHMLDEQRGEPLCACQACSVLFHREAASEGHYRLIPDRRARLEGFPDEEVDVPVGLVFFVRRRDESVVANYPNPIGGTQCDVDATTWQKIQERCPQTRGLAPMVEAVLVNTARGAHEHWIVPIDDCFRLVALIRENWRGMSGGTQVWPAIERFFAELGESPARPS